MTFFNPPKSRSKKIELDPAAVSSKSASVQQRMDRILENYQRLDIMLDEVEAKINGDERLKAIDESILEIELTINGRKKKWRSRKKSASPNKPR